MKARQKIAAWALITILFAQNIGVNIINDIYTVDQALFIELFCENKDEPMLNCNGNCMLSKLDEHSKDSPDKPILRDISQFHLYFYVQHSHPDFKELDLIETYHSFPYFDHYESQYLKDIFHPPILV